MITSMTGFGRGEAERDGTKVTVEAVSVNNRFCEVSVRLPRSLSDMEPQLAEKVRKRVQRGRVNLSVMCKELEATEKSLEVNMELAGMYRDRLSALQKELDLSGTVDINLIASRPDVFKYEPKELVSDQVWPLVSEACDAALLALNEMRQIEGKHLFDYFVERVGVLDGLILWIEKKAPERVERLRDRLQEQIERLLVRQVDEQRIAMEVAIFAERCDVTEECVRFHSHNHQFMSTLQAGEMVGRKLNFLLQEMNREANTIGSKSNDAEISHAAVSIKEEIEKLREQIQNVE
ncbi:MAG: YicC/YloC family endoribonuclease [Candidatus Latescibacterota bacterium]